MSFPIAVNTADGTCWTRRGALRGGEALYAPEGVCSCPEFVMATLAELAEHGIVGSADALPMPAGPEPVSEAELDAVLTEVSAFLRVRLALESAKRGRRELRAELYTAQAHGRTFLEQRNAHAKDLLELRGRLRVAEDQRVRALGENDALRKQLGDLGRERETLRERIAELEAAQGTVYRASHDSIVMGLYSTAAEARKHCETEMRRDLPTVVLDWIEDDEDDVAELVASLGEDERVTGYVVDGLEIAAEYDAEADE